MEEKEIIVEALRMMQEAHRNLRNLFDTGWQSEEYRLAILELERDIEIEEAALETLDS